MADRSELIQHARRRVLELFETQESWAERALQREAGLNITLFKEVMSVLTEQRLIQHRYNGFGKPEFFLVAPGLSPGVVLEGPLTPQAERVLEGLRHKPQGLTTLAKVIGLDPSLTHALAEDLERLGRVTRTQVGMLVIYRVSTIG